MKKLIVLSFLITSITAQAQMSAGFFSVTASSNYNAVGTKTWNTPGFGSNGFMTALEPAELTTGLHFHGFGFNIPTASAIVGAEAILTFCVMPQTSGNAILKDSIIQLMVNNVSVGNNLGGVHNFTPIVTTFTYGDPQSTWGASLTPAVVNATNFGFVSNLKSIGTATAFVGQEKSVSQSAKMKIYYVSTTGVIESQTSAASAYSFNQVLTIKNAELNSKIEIYSITGTKVKETIIERENEKINLEDLSKGIYIYRIRESKNEVTGKIILD